MLQCIAIDDEELSLELLEDNISKMPFLELVAKFHDPFKAVEVLQKETIDLIFLDIQMPGMNGLELLKNLRKDTMCILVTAYENFALQAFDLNVVDYLLKPVSLERFTKACTKALELHQLKDRPSRQPNDSLYIFINVDYSLVKVNFSEILYIEGLRDYIKIHLTSSVKPIVTRLSLKSIDEMIPTQQFIRIHKSYIVSKQQVTAIRKNTVFIGTQELPVGENFKDAIQILIAPMAF